MNKTWKIPRLKETRPSIHVILFFRTHGILFPENCSCKFDEKLFFKETGPYVAYICTYILVLLLFSLLMNEATPAVLRESIA